ncbi:MAG: M23 family peptidase, partial [Bacteroidota bacterium]
VSCKTNQFGSFFIIADTVSPSIKPINIIAGSIADSASIKIKVEDMLSGICCYKGLINGRWVLFEYDAKNDLLEYFFDEHTPEAKLDLDLTVWDKKGNSSTYKTSIKRK